MSGPEEVSVPDRVAIFDGPDWWGSSLVDRSGNAVTPRTATARVGEAADESRAIRELVEGFHPGCLIVSTGRRGAAQESLLAAGQAGQPTLAVAGIPDSYDTVAAVCAGLADAGARVRVFLCGAAEDHVAIQRWHDYGLPVAPVRPWEPPPEPDPEPEPDEAPVEPETAEEAAAAAE